METCDLRIGVATGEALVGSIGSDVMMSYTVMGDVVNLASRLEGANKAYGTRNLISERAFNQAGAAIEVREIDRVVVAGQTRSERVFEILGRKGELAPQQLASRDKYREGLAAYRERKWDDALRAFGASLESVPAAAGLGRVIADREIATTRQRQGRPAQRVLRAADNSLSACLVASANEGCFGAFCVKQRW
jgi:Adenylate and Guanylate cyclase catalytic domain